MCFGKGKTPGPRGCVCGPGDLPPSASDRHRRDQLKLAPKGFTTTNFRLSTQDRRLGEKRGGCSALLMFTVKTVITRTAPVKNRGRLIQRLVPLRRGKRLTYKAPWRAIYSIWFGNSCFSHSEGDCLRERSDSEARQAGNNCSPQQRYLSRAICATQKSTEVCSQNDDDDRQKVLRVAGRWAKSVRGCGFPGHQAGEDINK